MKENVCNWLNRHLKKSPYYGSYIDGVFVFSSTIKNPPSFKFLGNFEKYFFVQFIHLLKNKYRQTLDANAVRLS